MVGEGHKVWSLSPKKVSLIPQQSAHTLGVPTKFLVMQWKQQASLNVGTTQIAGPRPSGEGHVWRLYPRAILGCCDCLSFPC